MKANQHFLALDALRGIAAVCVLLFHVAKTSAPWILPHASLAVDFFFLLSGFVVASAYESRLRAGLGLWRFLTIRLIRLYPLIVAGVMFGAIGYARVYAGTTMLIVVISGLLLMPTPLAPRAEDFNAMPVNPPSWSLTFEILTNAIYAAIAKASTYVIFAIVICSAIALIVCAASFGSTSVGQDWATVWAGVPRVTVSFFAGVILKRMWRHSWEESLHESMLIPLALILIASLCIPVGWNHAWIYDCCVILCIYPIVVGLGIATRVSRMAKVTKLAGDLSYPIYILQGGFVPHLRGLPGNLRLQPPAAVLCIFGCSAAFCIFAFFVLKYFDAPVRRRLSKSLLGGRTLASRSTRYSPATANSQDQ